MIYVIQLNGRVLVDAGYFVNKYEAYNKMFDDFGAHAEYDVIEIAPGDVEVEAEYSE